MIATSQGPDPTVSQLRFAEVLLCPFRTAVVVAPLWLIYWMYDRFSLADVSVLYDCAIWFSAGMIILSLGKTIMAMWMTPDSMLLRDARRARGYFRISARAVKLSRD